MLAALHDRHLTADPGTLPGEWGDTDSDDADLCRCEDGPEDQSCRHCTRRHNLLMRRCDAAVRTAANAPGFRVGGVGRG